MSFVTHLLSVCSPAAPGALPVPLYSFTRVLAPKLDIGVADMGHSLTALLITGVHAVSVPVTAPPQGDT